MPVEFTTDQNLGHLTWISDGYGGPAPSIEEAAVVAAAEQAAGLRAIAEAISKLAEAVNSLGREPDK